MRKTAAAYDAWPLLRARIDADIATHAGLSAEARVGLWIQLNLIDEHGEGAMAEGQDVSKHIWCALLPQLERTRPAEAVRMLRTMIDDGLENTYSSRCRDVIEQMKRMTRIAHADHDVAAKAIPVWTSTDQHARKTKLIAMVAELSTANTATASHPRKR